MSVKQPKNQKSSQVVKKDIKLPSYHEVTFIDTEGEEIKTFSTYGKPGQVIKLESCPKSHPAWTRDGKGMINTKEDQVVKFNKKYKSLSDILAKNSGNAAQ